MRVLSLVVALILLGLAATSAFADFQYVKFVGETQLDGATATTGTINNTVGAPDTVKVTYTAAADADGSVLKLKFIFNAAVSNPGLIFYGIQATGTVTITELSWGVTSSYDPGANPTMNPSATVPTSSTDFSVLTSLSSYSNGGFNPAGGYKTVVVSFTMATSATLTIDAISNPEPGAIVLFALGAASLGGVVWRRRKRRAAASAVCSERGSS